MGTDSTRSRGTLIDLETARNRAREIGRGSRAVAGNPSGPTRGRSRAIASDTNNKLTLRAYDRNRATKVAELKRANGLSSSARILLVTYVKPDRDGDRPSEAPQ